ncbi:PREDICTED: uncharacterized protein LOC109173350 [Ipomoea nil]|uniref:uncharacterized protein LOC109173350 n=1 Tax=Ipomoea nil TaxID=35883 RepID=UPI000901E2A1|nr:PREDICTED: uncharacterized protein LOC109173350 [Ipomoea nil]
MAKMMTLRMKPMMEGIISDSQSAFIPNRLLTDNILITAEVGHYLNRKQCGAIGWGALKLDMAKTYDRLSLLLQQVQTNCLVHGCRVTRGAPPISHLFFADDSLLFFRANHQEANQIKNCLSIYESLSGQMVNYQKSSICYSRNTGEGNRDVVAQILGVVQAPNFGKYLGLPPFAGRNKRGAFAYIEDKIRQRIGSWSKKLLTQAGKEVLLKSVAQAMPTFSMGVFLLPSSTCTAIERTMNRYWWGSGTDRGIHWKAWDTLCIPKKYGGLGFKDLRAFNLAMLGKRVWRLLTKPDSLVARV